jgi:hypothetical protein
MDPADASADFDAAFDMMERLVREQTAHDGTVKKTLKHYATLTSNQHKRSVNHEERAIFVEKYKDSPYISREDTVTLCLRLCKSQAQIHGWFNEERKRRKESGRTRKKKSRNTPLVVWVREMKDCLEPEEIERCLAMQSRLHLCLAMRGSANYSGAKNCVCEVKFCVL